MNEQFFTAKTTHLTDNEPLEEVELHPEQREKPKTVKIVVAGPPHSGKSVFLGALSENLPRKDYFLFRACPDGEGSWLGKNYDDPDVTKHRIKGEFKKETVDWYCDTLSHNTMKPIVLVDIGGRISEQNARILTEGDVHYGVILSEDDKLIPEWEKFLTDNGVKVLATLHSDYNGTKDTVHEDDGHITGSVHHLERGESGVSERPMVHAMAERILHLKDMEVVSNTHLNEEKSEENKWEQFSENAKKGMLTIEDLADLLGKEKQTRDLPNGRTVEQINWEGHDLDRLETLFEAYKAELDDIICLDGAAPAWLISGISSLLKHHDIIVNSPDGFILTGIPEPDGEGAGAIWHTEQIATMKDLGMLDKEIPVFKAEFKLDPSIPLQPKDLWSIVPPEIPENAIVVISGRGPNWLVSSIADAYCEKSAAVACFQPGAGATVVWSREDTVPRGTVLSIKI